jgi:hypothetical protein
MKGSIPRLQSACNLVMNGTSIRYGCSQIFELFHPLNRTCEGGDEPLGSIKMSIAGLAEDLLAAKEVLCSLE